MTDNEIIKALECCTIREMDCIDCPNKEQGVHCIYGTMKPALDLINRQKAEIERLQKDKYRLQKALNQSEDYRLIAGSVAIEKFWTKVRAYAVVMGCYHIVEYGDSVIKEMVGEQL